MDDEVHELLHEDECEPEERARSEPRRGGRIQRRGLDRLGRGGGDALEGGEPETLGFETGEGDGAENSFDEILLEHFEGGEAADDKAEVEEEWQRSRFALLGVGAMNSPRCGMYPQTFDLDHLEMGTAAYDGAVAYARAKRAQVVLADAWAQRFGAADIADYAMHPGWVDTPGLRAGLPRFRRCRGHCCSRPRRVRTPSCGSLRADPAPRLATRRRRHPSPASSTTGGFGATIARASPRRRARTGLTRCRHGARRAPRSGRCSRRAGIASTCSGRNATGGSVLLGDVVVLAGCPLLGIVRWADSATCVPPWRGREGSSGTEPPSSLRSRAMTPSADRPPVAFSVHLGWVAASPGRR
ncbi:MAG TPA: hypothetical protein VMU75_13225 [Acidimicrobiales bacterium]|nr:hypothetical protein [Acidimicrobiales bacterium]